MSLNIDWLISAFIILYLFLAWSFDLPESFPEKKLIDKFKPWILWSGLFQSWRMFAPDPVMENRHLRIALMFADGSSTIIDHPEPQKMSVIDGFLNTRIRKWEENIFDHQHIRQAYAEYIAKSPEFAGKRVTRIAFVLVREKIPPPGSGEKPIIENLKFFDTPIGDTASNA